MIRYLIKQLRDFLDQLLTYKQPEHVYIMSGTLSDCQNIYRNYTASNYYDPNNYVVHFTASG